MFAAVTPIAVRLLTHSLASVGRTAGRLFAVSTAGSIAGTFATAFFLIPEFGTNQLLAQGAAAMFAAIALVAIVERLPIALFAGVGAAVIASIASIGLAPETGGTLSGVAAENWSPFYRLRGEEGSGVDFSAEGGTVAFTKDTSYHRLAVVDDAGSRYLRFDNSFQSGMYLNRPFATRFQYTDYLLLGLTYNPDAKDVLFVGLGGGSAQKRLWRDFKDVNVTAVELDPVVRDVAYRYFSLPRDPRLDVDVGGRPPVSRPRAEAVGRDRDRRLLLRLDPVPPDDAGVPPARPHAAEARRGRRRQHHRSAPRPRLQALPLVLPHLPHRVPHRARSSRRPVRRDR